MSRRKDPHKWHTVDLETIIKGTTTVVDRSVGFVCTICHEFTWQRPETVWQLPPCKCPYCGSRDHDLNHCPEAALAMQYNQPMPDAAIPTLLQIGATLQWPLALTYNSNIPSGLKPPTIVANCPECGYLCRWAVEFLPDTPPRGRYREFNGTRRGWYIPPRLARCHRTNPDGTLACGALFSPNSRWESYEPEEVVECARCASLGIYDIPPRVGTSLCEDCRNWPS